MPNRLAQSASPYLLQHADNPVDWYEWGEEAFEQARRRDVPLLISIGYSACHWCHVMAHESFEDPAIAAQMNRDFVNVKVDREERPDVDSIYMEATQAMTGHGGWPLTVFIDHRGAPFFTGTYFPPNERQGVPGFRSVLAAVSEAWRERRRDVAEQATRVTEAIGRRLPSVDDPGGERALASAVARLGEQFDSRYGGFGTAPKFPQQPVLEFLLRVRSHPWAEQAGDMVRHTLSAMAAGGIRDHLGGGFARYSVDDRWLVPHFEKMLYDNAQLARLYLWAGVEFESEALTEVAIDTLEYLLSDLAHPEGGFYSAEDADSEGMEGKFYVWDHGEFFQVAGEDAEAAAAYFGVTEPGNFEGANILHRARPIGEVAEELGLTPAEATEAVQRAGRRLAERRATRVRPGLDDKVVTAWNGLTIRALAEAGAVLGRFRYLAAARSAADFVLSRLSDQDGRLRRSWAKGRTGPPGVLEDYAGLAVGLFSLYAASGDVRWYGEAVRLVDLMVDLFADPDGGFFATPRDGEALVVRPRDTFDNPAPSGNSLATEALVLASSYSGDLEMWDRAEGAVRAAGLLIERAPSGVGHLLGVLATMLDGPRELAVVGPRAGELARVAWERFRPDLAVGWSERPSSTPPLLVGREGGGDTLAYVCRRFACQAPVATQEELRVRLSAEGQPAERRRLES